MLNGLETVRLRPSLNSETGFPLGLEKLEKCEGISGQGKVREI